MKLRTRLSLHFGALLAVALVVLGMIVYFSFTSVVREDREQLYRARVEMMKGNLEATMDGLVDSMLTFVLRNGLDRLADDDGDTQRRVLFFSRASEYLAANELLSGIALVHGDGSPVVEVGGARDPQTYHRVLATAAPDRARASVRPVVIDDGAELFLVRYLVPAAQAGEPLLLVFRVDRQSFAERVTGPGGARPIAILKQPDALVVMDGQHIAGEQARDRYLARLGGDWTVGQELEDARLFSTAVEPPGWTLYYAVPGTAFWSGLSEFPWRIFTALVVILFIGLDLIFVVAHRVVEPLSRLVRRTGNFNPHALQDGGARTSYRNDELGELEKSFDDMEQRMSYLIFTDPLTDLKNRRFLLSELARESERANRHRHDLSCLMIDIDKFKEINDGYGHQRGDEVLRHIAGLLQRNCRRYDTIGRYAGDEFVVIVPQASLDDAQALAAQLLQRVAESPLEVEGERLDIGVSIGVSSCNGAEKCSAETLLHHADVALYQAKSQGRNRFVAYRGDGGFQPLRLTPNA